MTDPVNLGDSYVGGEAVFYYNSGSFDSPSWNEIVNCGDLDIPDARTSVAAPIRLHWPFVGKLSGSRELGLSWTSQNKQGPNDTVTTALLQAYDSGNVVEFAVADGPIATTGTKFRRIGCIVTKADESQPLDNVVTFSFEAQFAVNSPYAPSRNTKP
jgi:hypothetical protein